MAWNLVKERVAATRKGKDRLKIYRKMVQDVPTHPARFDHPMILQKRLRIVSIGCARIYRVVFNS
jgi:hypothetical protein